MKQKQKILKFFKSAFLVILLLSVFFTPAYKVFAQTASCDPTSVAGETSPGACTNLGGTMNSAGQCTCPGTSGLHGACQQTSDCQQNLLQPLQCDLHQCLVPLGSKTCSTKDDCAGTNPACENGSCIDAGNTSGNANASPVGYGEICNHNANTPCIPDSGYVCIPDTAGTYRCSGANQPINSSPASGGGTTPASGGVSSTGDGSTTCEAPLIPYHGLCLLKNQFTTGIASSATITDLLLKVVKLLLGLSGAVALVILIIGGYWYITSAGNEEQAEKGRKALINAIIGIVVIILAFTIVTIINSAIT